MKTRFTVTIVGLLLAAATSASAQVLVGLTGGATYSDFSHPDTKSRWGYTAGLFLGRATYRTITNLEVSYIQKGGEGARIDYVETGLTAGGLAGGSRGIRGGGYGGVMVSFPVSCTVDNSFSLGLFCDNTNTEWSLPVGILLGKFNERGGFVGIDARYEFAMSDASLEVFNNTWVFRFVIGKPSGRR
jgi:hypothetical protein